MVEVVSEMPNVDVVRVEFVVVELDVALVVELVEDELSVGELPKWKLCSELKRKLTRLQSCYLKLRCLILL